LVDLHGRDAAAALRGRTGTSRLRSAAGPGGRLLRRSRLARAGLGPRLGRGRRGVNRNVYVIGNRGVRGNGRVVDLVDLIGIGSNSTVRRSLDDSLLVAARLAFRTG